MAMVCFTAPTTVFGEFQNMLTKMSLKASLHTHMIRVLEVMLTFTEQSVCPKLAVIEPLRESAFDQA